MSPGSRGTYRLIPVHALIEVLHLQLALNLCACLADAIGTLQELLLEGVAAGSPLVWLLAALQQQPAVHVDTQTRLDVYEGHGAEGERARRQTERERYEQKLQGFMVRILRST